MGVFVVAEAGVNHNGEERLALELATCAARAGADAVKFQTFRAERLVVRGTQTAEYQRANAGESDQFELLKRLELTEDAYRRVADHCRELGIEFMSTAFDEQSLDFLVSLGIRRIKIPSGELTRSPPAGTCGQSRLAHDRIDRHGGSRGSGGSCRLHAHRPRNQADGDEFTLLHCTSSYPAMDADVNLRAMGTLASRFAVPVGYSDHTLGTYVSIGAVALGATVIEKHFTLSRALQGPDHKASLIVTELTELVTAVRGVSIALGSDVKVPTAPEREVRVAVRRSVVASHALQSGQLLAERDLELLRPGTGIAPRDLSKLIGRRSIDRSALAICSGGRIWRSAANSLCHRHSGRLLD